LAEGSKHFLHNGWIQHAFPTLLSSKAHQSINITYCTVYSTVEHILFNSREEKAVKQIAEEMSSLND
jgi:hypothetical protein